MLRYGFWILVIVPVAVYLGVSLTPTTPATKIFVPTLPEIAPPSPGSGLVGTPSCSTLGCHDNPSAAAGPSSSFPTWSMLDPHARAYTTLSAPPAAAIAARLGIGRAEESPRCLSCHTNPSLAGKVSEPQRLERRFGVSCEVCHGAAGLWLRRHPGWAGWPDSRRTEGEAAGLVWLPDPEVRARLCADCHVGSPEEKGLPQREVDHDLIAAGHPALHFELTGHQKAMPQHWTARGDERGERVRDWAVGQTVVARAALRVLADQADNPDHPWPEFAASDCRSCHHRLKSGGPHASPDTKPRLGEGPYALLPRALALEGKAMPEAFKDLEGKMRVLSPDRATVARLARLAESKLPTGPPPVPGAAILDLHRAALAQEGPGLALSSWEGAFQVYRAVAATDGEAEGLLRLVGRRVDYHRARADPRDFEAELARQLGPMRPAP